MQYSDVGGSDIQIAAKSYLMELEINDGPKGWLLAVFSLVKPIVKEVEEKGIMLLIDGNLCAASVYVISAVERWPTAARRRFDTNSWICKFGGCLMAVGT